MTKLTPYEYSSESEKEEWVKILGDQDLYTERVVGLASAVVHGPYGTAFDYAYVPGFAPGYERMISFAVHGNVYCKGELSIAAATANDSYAESRRQYSIAAITGCRSHAKCGERSIAAAIGDAKNWNGAQMPPCTVQGGMGSILILRGLSGALRAVEVDGTAIMPDTPYILDENENFIVCEQTIEFPKREYDD